MRVSESAPAYAAGGISHLMGIELDSAGKIIRQVRAGLPPAALEPLQNALDIPRSELAEAISIPARTLARRQKETRLSPDESDRVLRLARLFDLALRLFEGDEAKARAWFKAPSRALGGESPLQYSQTEPGGREVENLAGRLEHGIFS